MKNVPLLVSPDILVRKINQALFIEKAFSLQCRSKVFCYWSKLLSDDDVAWEGQAICFLGVRTICNNYCHSSMPQIARHREWSTVNSERKPINLHPYGKTRKFTAKLLFFRGSRKQQQDDKLRSYFHKFQPPTTYVDTPLFNRSR